MVVVMLCSGDDDITIEVENLDGLLDVDSKEDFMAY